MCRLAPFLILLCSLTFAAAVHAADPLPWTKTPGLFGSLTSLENECRSQGGTPTDVCYNYKTNVSYPWQMPYCPSGSDSSVTCKASATGTNPPPSTAGVGGSCPNGLDSECDGTAVCDPSTKKCVAPDSGTVDSTSGVGGPCQTDNGCRGGLVCSPAKTCAYPSDSSGGSAAGTSATTGTGDSGTPQGTSGATGATKLENPLNNINSLPDLLDTILKALVELGSILLTVMLVYVGFLFVSAQGNAEKLSSARSALMWTVIGGLILLGAEAISQVIQATVKSL